MRPKRTARAIRQSRQATASLVLSILFALVGLAYFLTSGRPVIGVVIAVLIVAAGVWEAVRTVRSKRRAERFEADAAEQERRYRG